MFGSQFATELAGRMALKGVFVIGRITEIYQSCYLWCTAIVTNVRYLPVDTNSPVEASDATQWTGVECRSTDETRGL